MHGTDLLCFPWMQMEMQTHDQHSVQMPCECPLPRSPRGMSLAPGREEEHVCSSSKAAGGQKPSGAVSPACPTLCARSGLSRPAPPQTPGYVPVSHHHTLDGLHGSGPVARTVPEAKGSQAKANSREGWANVGINSRLQGGRKWKRELLSAITLGSLRPSTAAAALWQRPLPEGGAALTPWMTTA